MPSGMHVAKGTGKCMLSRKRAGPGPSREARPGCIHRSSNLSGGRGRRPRSQSSHTPGRRKGRSETRRRSVWKARAMSAAAPPTMSRTSTEAAASFETPNQYAPLAGVAADPGDHVLACPGDETVTATEGRRAPSARIAAQGRKTYTDTGPIPVVSSGGRAMDRPTEPPIPAAI